MICQFVYIDSGVGVDPGVGVIPAGDVLSGVVDDPGGGDPSKVRTQISLTLYSWYSWYNGMV